MADSFLFSGEPLPLAPIINRGGWANSAKGRASELELDNFHRKLLDYIRRLGAKLSNPVFPPGGGGSTGAIPIFAAGIDGDQAVGASYAPIEWDRFFRKDTDTYTHDISTNPGEITLLREGMYVFWVDGGVRPMSAEVANLLFRLVETTLGIVDYSETNLDGRDDFVGQNLYLHHGAFHVSINAAAGAIFTIEAIRTGSTYTLDEEHTRLTIMYFPVTSDTDYPVVPGCDGPFDCFYTLP